jgi:hypothetical protein
VAITLPSNYGREFQSFMISVSPPTGGSRPETRTIYRGSTLFFQTATGTGLHQFVFSVAAGNSVTIPQSGSGLRATGPRPNYTLTVTTQGGRNVLTLTANGTRTP